MAEMVKGAATDVSDVIGRVADAFTGTDFDVVPEPAVALPSVAVPLAVIETVLTGLIENSRQASASRISIAARATGGFVELEFRDDGTGVPAGDRARIFEPFFTSRRTSGGTGLGLPIIRSLLHAHRSTISLDRNDGRGAAFIVTLPACFPVPTSKA
jgi:signal transduction histidine kinase